jgi:RNA 2',3'-cyclic 3'-phosphodiesterase
VAKSSRSRERPGSPRARLFVALEPGEADRRALGAWRDAVVAGRDDLRPVAPETLHLTLAFLGYRPEKEIPAIAAAAFEPLAGVPPVELLPAAVVPVPRRGPRLFALDLEDPSGGAGRIQAAVVEALAAKRFHRPEKRPWWPHLTLARVKRNVRAEPLEVEPPEGPIRATRVTLYRSILRPQGALYEPLAQCPLSQLDAGSSGG